MKCALKREERGSESGHAHSWHWWLGRLNFFEQIIQRFSWDFLLANCIYRPPFSPPSPDMEDSLTSMSSMRSVEAPPSSLEFPSDEETDCAQQANTGEEREVPRDTLVQSNATCGPPREYLLPPAPTFPRNPPPRSSPAYHPSTEGNLLAQVWYFAAQATHIPHNKVGKLARRVIIRIAKVLRNEAFSLEIVRDVVSRCHRTQAEGLLDRVVTAREKPTSGSREGSTQSQSAEKKKKRGSEQAASRGKEEEKISAQTSTQSYSPFPNVVMGKKREVKETSPHAGVASAKEGIVAVESRRLSGYGSDDSYRSAVSDLSGEEREEKRDSEKGGGRGEGQGAQSSSGASSDGKSEERQSKSSASGNSADTVKLPRWVWLLVHCRIGV